MLMAHSAIISEQAKPTENAKKVKLFLDYATTNPEAIITYQVSDMILATHSDASYLSEPKQGAVWGDTFSCPQTPPSPPTMEQSTTLHK